MLQKGHTKLVQASRENLTHFLRRPKRRQGLGLTSLTKENSAWLMVLPISPQDPVPRAKGARRRRDTSTHHKRRRNEARSGSQPEFGSRKPRSTLSSLSACRVRPPGPLADGACCNSLMPECPQEFPNLLWKGMLMMASWHLQCYKPLIF